MNLPINYKEFPLWLTIDIEELFDSNFNLVPKKSFILDYDSLLDNWLVLCEEMNFKSTAFILGSFADKYPHIVKKLSDNGHEIASHGQTHDLVYSLKLEEWKKSINDSKKTLEDIIGKEVNGYRSASWSLPFEQQYYETLVDSGYTYSSSYFPLKTYLYGNSIDKKWPFEIHTSSGVITEIPIPKLGIPYSGGFYLRMLPSFLQKILMKRMFSLGVKPVIYIHPYELVNPDFITKYFLQYFKKNIDFFLAFGAISRPIKDIDMLLKLIEKK